MSIQPGGNNETGALGVSDPSSLAGKPPEGMDYNFLAFEGLDIVFDPSRFQYYDEDGHTFVAIILASLPDIGTLFLGDDPITAAEVQISYEDLFRLKWVIPTGIVGPDVASFEFQVVDETGDIDLSPATIGIGVKASPLGTDKTITVHSGGSHTFAAADFGFSDSQGYQFHGVIIEAIPDGSSLKLRGQAVWGGDLVLVSDLDQLVWTTEGGSGSVFELEFAVVNDNHTPGIYAVRIDALRNILTFVVADTPPTGSDATIAILEDGAHQFSASNFGFDDGDGDAFAAVVIVATAGAGRLLFDGTLVGPDQRIEVADLGKLVWAPNKDANGQALGTIRFRVVDDSQTENTAVTENTITFDVTAMPETFTGTAGHDRMSGTADDDTFYGLAGNDSIDGIGGADTMRGGVGNDTYAVDRTSDKTIETAGQGIDTVRSALAWTLGVNVENLTLLGSKAIKGTGNAQKNALTGNAGANSLNGFADSDILKGMNGKDVLNGGAGADKLYGGAHGDTFVFDAPLAVGNRDTIVDFSARDDTIWLDNGTFRKLVKTGKLSKDNFKLSTETRDGNDYVVYNQAKGALYYDADGSGRAAAVLFATLANHAKLTAADFVVV